jgi:outer membrane lipoprotein SlyB
MRAVLVLGMLVAAVVAPALAHGATPFAVNGTVQSVDATSITVKTDDGAGSETFKLSPDVLVVQGKPATLHDIKPNDFVASAAVRKADGKLHSTELRIFPEAMRGVGVGQRPMHDAGNQTMTNATVAGTAIVDGSNRIMVKFPGGESELILDPGVPVTAIVPVDKSSVQPGAKVRVQGEKTNDQAVATRIALR